ncbi:hypothetical protein PV08_01024 [Exophiala spinifera]|uniref:RRM domain-containing protein n=1 Tax=Exophiala spinifera TaxID=91928 RepID=A0A0D2CA66_9EURO|nr:uncharacterized protein PV08_01024 [Exophiala spinifera]KIW20449.1 hypothetical protein PV08_01024 [Exophiala spinifera]
MPDPKTAVSFDAIIQANRQRKKNEALANEIFGRNKQTRGDSRSSSKVSTRTPDLASRITKVSSHRSSSVASSGSARNTSSRPSSTTPQQARAARLASALETQQANIVTPPRQSTKGGPSLGLSIKGKAGPFTVEASNFAPGTTAADIESALQGDTIDDNGASGMLSCRIVATAPAVVAEMIFSERHIADRVISTYNNQRADGRILHLYLKQSGSGPTPVPSGGNAAITPTPPEPVASNHQFSDNGMDDVEMESEAPLAQDDRDRERDRRPAKSDSDSRDGRRDDYDDRRDDDRRDRDRDRDRERERERERERDRDRERDRERDQRYDRRDDRAPNSSTSSYRDGGNNNSTPNNHSHSHNSYNSRSSHYGNGVGGPGRGMYGGPTGGGMYHRGGGRMYSDGRGGGGSGRGGFGSGYRRGY